MRWIIGDIHGMLRALDSLIDAVQREDASATFYFVGDYVNRGPDSRGVIDRLLQLPTARFLRGNHDDLFDQIINGKCFAQNASRGDRFVAFKWFIEHGLHETLRSYDVSDEVIGKVLREQSPDSIAALIDAVPPSHRKFIQSLEPFIDDADLFVVHGYWPIKQKRSPSQMDAREIGNQQRHDMLWARFTEADLYKSKAWPKTGFFGHTPVSNYKKHNSRSMPIVAPKAILLDTAVALNDAGRLTAMCAETAQLIQTDPKGNVVESAVASQDKKS